MVSISGRFFVNLTQLHKITAFRNYAKKRHLANRCVNNCVVFRPHACWQCLQSRPGVSCLNLVTFQLQNYFHEFNIDIIIKMFEDPGTTMHLPCWFPDAVFGKQTTELLLCLVLWRCLKNQHFFTALHGMQTRSSDESFVCPSVCQTRGLWQNWRKICPDF